MSPARDFAYFDAPTPLALAHRGGAKYAPNVGRENTVAAFAEAMALGYRYLETDVHATADGKLVAFHDTVLDRVTDAKGTIAELPWSEVSQARIDDQPIPLMEELAERFPTARFNIDIKSEGSIAPLADLIARQGLHDRVCVGSFSDRRLRTIRRLVGPGLATSAGPVGVAEVRLLPRRISGLLTSGVQALQIPVTHALRGREVAVVTPRLIAAAHALGKQVHVWTIDEADEMHRLLDLGVDGIVSDRIDTLAAVLAERGHPLTLAD